MTDFYRIKSISEVHQMFGLEKPLHPLITIIRKWPKVDFDFSTIKLTSDLFLLSMKGKMKGTTFQYGRNSYDFEEGTLVFIAPNQVASFADPIEELDDSGWSILFHPDLIRKSELGKTIKDYSFFNYETNESLHLSEKEKQSLLELVEKINLELNQNMDKHSQDIIIQNLVLLGVILKQLEIGILLQRIQRHLSKSILNTETNKEYKKVSIEKQKIKMLLLRLKVSLKLVI